MMHRYDVHGLALASEFELPELHAAAPSGDHGSAPDVIICSGGIAARRPAAVTSEDGFTLDDGVIYVDVPSVASYAVAGGDRVTVSPAANAPKEAIRAHLLGQALPCLLHQRGLFPLHASAVATPLGVIAFSGDSGLGKSTIAALLAARGFPILSDDELVITPENSGIMQAWPSFPMSNFNADSAGFLGLEEQHRWSNYRKYGKLPFRREEAFATTPVIFRQLYCLEWQDKDNRNIDIQRLGGFDALLRLRSCVLYRDLVGYCAGEAAFAAWAEQVLEFAEVLVLRRPPDFGISQQVLDAILANHPREMAIDSSALLPAGTH